MPERRNPVVRAGAILRKGGVHTKSVSGQRHRQRLRIDDAVDEWYEEISNPDDPPVENYSLHPETQEKSQRQQIIEHGDKKTVKGQPKAAPSGFCLLNSPVKYHTRPYLKLGASAIALDFCCISRISAIS